MGIIIGALATTTAMLFLGALRVGQMRGNEWSIGGAAVVTAFTVVVGGVLGRLVEAAL